MGCAKQRGRRESYTAVSITTEVVRDEWAFFFLKFPNSNGAKRRQEVGGAAPLYRDPCAAALALEVGDPHRHGRRRGRGRRGRWDPATGGADGIDGRG